VKRIVDTNGRIQIPKETREGCGLESGTRYRIIEHSDYLEIRPDKELYTITSEEMKSLRKLYLMLSKNDFLDTYYETLLASITRKADVKCEHCGNYMFLTKDNTYKCFECGD
jgi:AbrB family looped-hinge helix DNA binding protein